MAKLLIGFATYVTWGQLSGSTCKIEDLRHELSVLPKIQTINACALINAVLRTWGGKVDLDEHEQLLKVMFAPDVARRLDEIARRPSEPAFVWHRQQLLFLIKEASVHSKDSDDIGGEFDAAFAKCCLMANDLLHHGLSSTPDRTTLEQFLPEMVTVSDYLNRESILHKAARTRIMLEEILARAEIRNRPEFLDVPKLFLDATKLTVREHYILNLATLTKFLKLSFHQYIENREAFVLTEGFFRGTQVDFDKVLIFLQDVAQELGDLSPSCAAVQRKNDYTPLRNRPLLGFQGRRFIPLDVGFLADKLDSGVFWRVHNESLNSPQEREGLHTLWGHIFERYVTELMQNACPDGSPNRFIASPQFEHTGPACDALVVCGSTAILMECKGSMLTGEAKYGGEPETLVAELGTKFIGTEDKPKGLRQLARSIRKWGDKGHPEPIIGVAQPRRIYPVLVAREGALASPFMNRWLNERFQVLLSRKMMRPIITSLFVLTVDELEQITPYLLDIRLDQILESKYVKDRVHNLPFCAVPNEVLDRAPQRVNLLLERKFRQVMDEACMDLFGRPFQTLELPDLVDPRG